MGGTLRKLEKIWSGIVPDYPFEYEFLDDKIDQYYKLDQYFASAFSVFSTAAIIISCLGLFGLVAFTTQNRAKEIGVTKVLGASTSTIVRLTSHDYLKLVLLAALVAIPISYYTMSGWLENFVYRIGIKPYVFVSGLLISLFFSCLSVGYLSFCAASANPADSLRSE